MHPAASVIFFTTASGAGYGLLFLLGIAGAAGLVPASLAFGLVGFTLAFGLITAGLLASTFHLGRPERAWRALSQWRSSWLSREGVAALVTYAPAGLFALGWVVFGEARGIWGVFGLLGSLGAVATVVCTGMIYASLPTIRQWRQPLTIPVYLTIGLYTGALWMALLSAAFGGAASAFLWLAVLAGLSAAGVKALYWRTIDTEAPVTTSGTATGLGSLGRVRLLDAPTTSQNYVMREMGYRVARKHAMKLRAIAAVIGVAVPVLLLLIAAAVGGGAAVVPVFLAALSGSAGAVVERWLFFAEATHVVTTYYGAEAA
ncbi:DMSO reductase chain C [alpha proteobacterium BAL199]|jgi:sulfite dehydrogenase (quinone) subunit SoeC|nr:DMSO reductase chain C [alpha proteobacterium BAL199]